MTARNFNYKKKALEQSGPRARRELVQGTYLLKNVKSPSFRQKDITGGSTGGQGNRPVTLSAVLERAKGKMNYTVGRHIPWSNRSGLSSGPMEPLRDAVPAGKTECGGTPPNASSF